MTPKRILIADDQPGNRTSFSAILTHSGSDLLLAPNGKDSVEQARLHTPDLI